MQTIREELKSLLLNNYQIGAADFEQLLSISKRVRLEKAELLSRQKRSLMRYFWSKAALPAPIFGMPREMK